MKTEKDLWEELEGRNPFKVPAGYFEGLTEQIMSRIPIDSYEGKGKVISLYDRMRPWLYMAAAFVGLLLIFKVFIGPATITKEVPKESAFVVASDDYVDYLEALENEYYSELYAEAIDRSE
ncbi:MAG: hypothetical protein LBR49_06080 [Tannerella sp.]|jgi:hypothetical protein|nr:hypothetical protein [Tannerella sp.]